MSQESSRPAAAAEAGPSHRADDRDELAGVLYRALAPWLTAPDPGRPLAEALADAVLDAGWTRLPTDGGTP